MVSSKATTVDEYLASLAPDRRSAIAAVRAVIRKNLPAGFEEGMQYGMIGYYVPLSRYPNTYNGQALGVAAIASQKQHMSVYLMAAYGDPETRAWFEERYRASGKKLDMGKSCVRFEKLEDLALDVIGETVARVSVDQFLAGYERARGSSSNGAASAGATKAAAKKVRAKKATAKKATAKKATAKKATAKKATAKKAPAKKRAARPALAKRTPATKAPAKRAR